MFCLRSREYIVPSVCGPLTTSLATLEYFTEAVLAAEPWLIDPVTIPLPWRRDLAAKPTRPLRIGYYYDDGAVRVQPPHEFAVRKVVAALTEAVHEGERATELLIELPSLMQYEVSKWDTEDHAYGYDLWLKAVKADGGRRCRLQCEKEGEPLIEGMVVGTKEDELNVEEGEAVRSIPTSPPVQSKCMLIVSQLHREIREYQKMYLSHWQESGVDALILPVQPYVGLRPREWVKSSQYIGYSAIWNLLDYTGLVMPVPVPDAEDIEDVECDPRGKWEDHKPRNEGDRYNWEQCKKFDVAESAMLILITDDPSLIKGVPIDVQIVTGKFGEEKAVAVAKAVEEALSSAST